MSNSRRKFLKIGAFSVIAQMALGSRGFARNATESIGDAVLPDTDNRLMTLRAGDFRNQIGSRFELRNGNDLQRATLTEVKSSKLTDAKSNTFSEHDLLDYKNFTLTFQLNRPIPAPQLTYSVSHSILGDFQLFLVPGFKAEASRTLLTAVINRI